MRINQLQQSLQTRYCLSRIHIVGAVPRCQNSGKQEGIRALRLHHHARSKLELQLSSSSFWISFNQQLRVLGSWLKGAGTGLLELMIQRFRDTGLWLERRQLNDISSSTRHVDSVSSRGQLYAGWLQMLEYSCFGRGGQGICCSLCSAGPQLERRGGTSRSSSASRTPDDRTCKL